MINVYLCLFADMNPYKCLDISERASFRVIGKKYRFACVETSARAPDEATALLYVIFVCIYCWWPFEFRFEFRFEDRPTDQPTDRQTDL